MTRTVKTYQVLLDDTLQRIAQTTLGDANRWSDIAALNTLRPPYISADLTDQLGPPLGQLALQAGATLGVDSTSGHLLLGNWIADLSGYAASTALLVAGNILVFAQMDQSGTITYEAAQITSSSVMVNGSGQSVLSLVMIVVTGYNSLSGRLNTALGGFTRHYSTGQLIGVYGNPALLTTAVARPGDSILLPIFDQGGQVGVANALNNVDALGTDIALDQNGQIQADQQGGILTVSGTANVRQAVRARFKTVPGELAHHPDYGFQGHFYLGANRTKATLDLISALATECLLAEPRIRSVDSVAASAKDDAIFLEQNATIAQNGQVLADTYEF